MIRIEYRCPWDRDQWSCFGVTTRSGWAQELLDVCRQNHPGCECRIHEPEDDAIPRDLVCLI